MRQLFANNISTTLSAPLAAGNSSLSVVSAAGFPIPTANQYFLVTIQSGSSFEIIEITGVTGTTFTIGARAQEGTTAQSFPAGALCEMRITAGTLANLEAESTQLASISSLVAPVATTVDSYSVQDTLDPSGTPLLLCAAGSYIWVPVNYALYSVDASATISSTTTLTTTLGQNFVGTISGNAYLVQFTTGNFAGQVKVVTAITSSTLTFSPALSSVSGGTNNVILYQFSSLLRFNAAALQFNGTTGQNIVSLTGNTTLTTSQSGLDFIGPNSACTITLPAGTAGTKYRIFAGGGNIVLIPASGSLILQDGSSNATWTILGNYGAGVHLLWDGSNWRVEAFGNAPASVATSSSGAVTLGQVAQWIGTEIPGQTPSAYAGSASPGTTSLALAPRGQVVLSQYYSDSPLGTTTALYGVLTSYSASASNDPTSTATTNWWHQVLWTTLGRKFVRYNVNGAGWSAWLELSTVNQLQNQTTPLSPTTISASGTVSGANATGGQNYLTWTQSTNNSFSPAYANLGANGNVNFTGTFTYNGGSGGASFQSGDLNQVRLIAGNYGTILRNDGNSFYLLTTASGSPTGSFNALRPFSFALSTGAVSIDQTGAGTTFGGAASGANATGGQNFLTWAQSTNGTFSPSYAAVTATGLQVNGAATVTGAVTMPSLYFSQTLGQITWAGANTAIFQDTTGNGPGDLVIKTGTGAANYYSVFTNSGGLIIPGWVSAGGAMSCTTLNTTGSINLNNGQYLYAKDSGGTNRQLIGMSTDNYVTLVNSYASRVRIVNQAYNAEIWSCDNSGNMWAAGNVSAYSDERVKKDWEALPPQTIYKLAALEKSGTYTRTDEDFVGGRQLGVGAQSLREILKEAVLEDKDGKLSVNYGAAALTLCVELAKKVVELEKRLEQLK